MTVGIKQSTTYIQNGLASDIFGVKTPTGQGLSVPSLCRYTIIPTYNNDSYVCSLQNVVQNQYLAFRATYSTTYNGQTVVLLDCARSLQVESNAVLTGADYSVLISGYDINYKFIQETVFILNGATRGYSVKMFLIVVSVLSNYTTTFRVQVGTYNKFGLPFYLKNKTCIDRVTWNDVDVALANVTPGYNWRATGNVSLTTSDNNGSVLVDAGTPNSQYILSIQYYCYGADSELANNLNNQVMGTFPSAVPSRQISTSIITFSNVQRNATNTQYVYGGITPYDLIGPQYPEDNAFLSTYRTVLNS